MSQQEAKEKLSSSSSSSKQNNTEDTTNIRKEDKTREEIEPKTISENNKYVVIYYRKQRVKLPPIAKIPEQYQIQSLVSMICQQFGLYSLSPSSLALIKITKEKAREYDEIIKDKSGKKVITLPKKHATCFSFVQPIPKGYYFLHLLEYATKCSVLRKLSINENLDNEIPNPKGALVLKQEEKGKLPTQDISLCSVFATLTLKRMFNACYLVVESTVVSSVNSKQMAQLEFDFIAKSGDIKKLYVVEYSPLTEERTRMITQSHGMKNVNIV
jgi:hypothetical protein